MKRVFISYRRTDTAREANLLREGLEFRIPEVAAFVDRDEIEVGERWQSKLEEQIDRAEAVLVLIGPDWRRADDGRDRLRDPDDWVRREVELALATRPDRLLPIVIEGADAQLDDLPPTLEPLTEIQVARLGVDSWFDDRRAIVSWVADKIGTSERGAPRWPKPDRIKQLAPPLDDEVIAEMMRSGGLDGWAVEPVTVDTERAGRVDGRELRKTFTFANFRQAMRFVSAVGDEAERFNHHPVWTNRWNTVEVQQRTWDQLHNLSSLDFQMASYMNKVARAIEIDQSG